jgi:hypothetical protein
MTNTYRPLSAYGKATYGEDDVDLDLSVMEEKDALDGGHLDLVPRKYKVLTDNFSGGPQNGEYVGALRKETEAALIHGGHIERVDDKPSVQGGVAKKSKAAAEPDANELVVPTEK